MTYMLFINFPIIITLNPYKKLDNSFGDGVVAKEFWKRNLSYFKNRSQPEIAHVVAHRHPHRQTSPELRISLYTDSSDTVF